MYNLSGIHKGKELSPVVHKANKVWGKEKNLLSTL